MIHGRGTSISTGSSRGTAADGVLLHRLSLLGHLFRPEAGDVVEVDFRTSGEEGALVYTRRRRPPSAFRNLLSALGTADRNTELIRSLLLGVPAQSHAIRISPTGISLFFRIELPRVGMMPLAEALGVPEAASFAHEFFDQRGTQPCGFAVEVSPGGKATRPRLRFYDVALGSELRAVGRTAAACGLEDLPAMLETLPILEGLGQAVLNVGGNPTGPTLKIELPSVHRSALADAHLDKPERATWKRATLYLRRAETEAFSYVGWRWQPGRRRELTFYVDGWNLLSGL